ncbi:hypothetical protein V8F33_000969 [Rhypophila sp. PSN 637]
MASPTRPVFPPPAMASAESSPAASTTESSPEGGVRLDAGEFTPPPSQLFRRPLPALTRAFPRAADNANDDDESSSEDEESDEECEESDEDASKTTPVGELGTSLPPIDEKASDSERDHSDDVFSPASSNSGPLSAFAQRLQLSATRSQTVGTTQMSTSSARPAIRPSRSVTFKDETETISAEATPTLSPTKTIGERRLARRAATIGVDVVHPTPAPLTFPPPQSNVSGHQQTGDVDAQGLYAATACVFVANLPEPEDDLALEAAVTRAFCVFGTVYVKIRRDNNNMPFAFCQYTKDEDAVRAMEDGKGTMILGRPCRTEMVKANRSFIIYKRNRMTITVDEARGVMENYGALSACDRLDEQARKTMKLPPSVLVEYAKFDPARDAVVITRQNLGYAVEPYDARKRAQVTRSTGDEAFLKQYDTDRRSVYVAGLPPDIEQDEVARYFGAAGEVVSVEIIRRTLEGGKALSRVKKRSGKAVNQPKSPLGKDRVFAFVEFTRLDVPDIAIAKLDNTNIRDDDENSTLRVQRKEVKPPRTPKRVQSMNQLETRVADRNRLASPRSHGSLNAQEMPGRGYHGTSAPAQAGAQAPETPRSHQMQPPGATQAISPLAFRPHGGAPSPMHPAMMYYGFPPVHSPPGYDNQHMQGGPGVFGSAVPNTPPGFSSGMNTFYANGAFWPTANLYAMPDQTGGLSYGYLTTYNTSPTHGVPPTSGLESPVRSSGMGQIGSGLGHAGFGHPGFGHPVSSTGHQGSTMGQSGAGIVQPGFGHPVSSTSHQGSNIGQSGTDIGQPGFGYPVSSTSYQGSTMGQSGAVIGHPSHLGSGPAHLGSGLGPSGSGIGTGHPGRRSGSAANLAGLHPAGRRPSHSGDRIGSHANDMARPDNKLGHPGSGTNQSESDK